MTLTQLEYIVALDSLRHFALAAEKCFVTQPTLSMQIHKLEDELGVKLFDRSKQPVMPTAIGVEVIAQARRTLREASAIRQIISDQQQKLSGELRIGIIPTLAPYLLPALHRLTRTEYPQLHLAVKECITEQVIHDLKEDRIDCGIVVTPLHEASIREEVLFYEELFLYVSRSNALADKHYVLAQDIDPNQLWLLEEGHCFRSQVLNLCELRKRADLQFRYEAGSIETLKRMVDGSDGITILPELAVMELGANSEGHVKRLEHPRPAREVSLVTHRDHIKTRLIHALRDQLKAIVPERMQALAEKRVVEIG